MRAIVSIDSNPTDDTKARAGATGGLESASTGEASPNRPDPTAAIGPSGGPEASRLTWSERGTKRLNRLRAVVARSLLATGDSDVPTAEAAVAFLRRVVDGSEPASIETRATAAATLTRAAVTLSKETDRGTPSVDARSVTVNIGAGEGAMLPGVPEAVRAALAAFRKDAGGGDAGGDGKAAP